VYSFTESVENSSAQSEKMLHIVGKVKEIEMTKYGKKDNGEKE